MNLEGKTCANCLEGKWHKTQDQIAEGVFVDAYKCDTCDQVTYSKHIMKKVEALFKDQAETRSLIKVGASLALSIPASIVKRLRLKPKEKVYVTSRGNEIVARVAHS